MPAAFLFAAAMTVGGRAGADTLSQCDFSDASNIVFNGSASQVGDMLQLTTGNPDEDGSAYYATAIPWTAATSFHTAFQFQIITSDTEAEGLSFIIQDAGPTAVGSLVHGLGYDGITPKEQMEVDTSRAVR
jgi:hypothetical protein